MTNNEVATCLSGGGESGRRLRELDWNRSSLGPPDRWPQNLRTALAICLGSRHPMEIWWGPDFVRFFNDSYASIIGKSQAASLGLPGRLAWPVAWVEIGPMLELVRESGEATWAEDFALLVERGGGKEEGFFTFSLSPIWDEDGRVAGIFNACQETTERVLQERRMRTIREVALRSETAEEPLEVARLALEALDKRRDIPFAMLFWIEADGTQGRLVASTGLGNNYTESLNSLWLGGESRPWPLLCLDGPQELPLPSDLALSPAVAPDDRPRRALLLPIRGRRDGPPLAALVAGASPQLPLNPGYRQFFEELADEIGVRLRDASVTASLRESSQLAEAASRAKTDFLANMSHEIRTPMTAVLGYADILRASLTGNEDRACLEVIQKNGRHLMEIINQILDLSKIEAGKLYLDVRAVKLLDIVQGVRALMLVQAEQKGLHLEVAFSGQVPQILLTDGGRVRQVLVNLLGNAIKFTEKGSVSLRIWFQEATNLVTFEVSDTGIGIERQHLAALFQPFSQVEGVSRRFGGTGLGLAICKQLVELLGGSIEVLSEAGVGSVFRFSVDAGNPEELAMIQPTDWKPGEHSSADVVDELSLRERRILVVDDRRDIRILMGSYLEDAGAAVETAENGMVALRLLESIEVDLVLLDMQMPVLTGYELAHALRERGFDAPILAVTARAMKGDRDLCIEAGCSDYLSKPVESGDLLARVTALLEQARNNTNTRVLIVEDNPMAAMAVAAMLERSGCTVCKAPDGERAMQFVREQTLDLVLLDLQLPDCTGYELLQRIRERQPAVYVAAHTGRTAEEVGSESGFDEVLQKPVHAAALKELVARAHRRLRCRRLALP